MSTAGNPILGADYDGGCCGPVGPIGVVGHVGDVGNVETVSDVRNEHWIAKKAQKREKVIRRRKCGNKIK
jgi:hypothetical protein